MTNSGDAHIGELKLASTPEHQVALSRFVQNQIEKDAGAAAPERATERMIDVTREGIARIPEGFKHSLNPRTILPNIGTGIVLGALSKALLPESGPVASVVGELMSAYFLGKPLVDCYSRAIEAKTMADMHRAASILGDSIGGMPVSMIEGSIGSKIGSQLAGRALNTSAGETFSQWRDTQYNKLGLDLSYLFASKPVPDRLPPEANKEDGVIPPYLLEELSKRNPNNQAFNSALKQTRTLADTHGEFSQSISVDDDLPQDVGARLVCDGQGLEAPVRRRIEGMPPTGDVDVDKAYDYMGEIRSFYKDVFNCNSIDGKGMILDAAVNWSPNYLNASWGPVHASNGKMISLITYGTPGPDSPFKTFVLRDVTAHELGHGVMNYLGGQVLSSRGQGGALNEHLADVMGAITEQKLLNQTADQADWLIGKGIFKDNIHGRALRDMLNPGTAYDDPAIGKDPQPASMKDYVFTSRDANGVHINCGIPNRAFALFARRAGGRAWEAPGHIWFEARKAADLDTQFAQFAFDTVEAAKKLGYSDLLPRLEQSWNDVGIKPTLTPDRVYPLLRFPRVPAIIAPNDYEKKSTA